MTKRMNKINAKSVSSEARRIRRVRWSAEWAWSALKDNELCLDALEGTLGNLTHDG
jgi:hypothetical protein